VEDCHAGRGDAAIEKKAILVERVLAHLAMHRRRARRPADVDVEIALRCALQGLVTPSANEQHNPYPLARWSNHGLSGESANRPSSRANGWPGTSMAKPNAKAAKSLNLYIVR
jgi:hypothetical protein